jgi:hypothetical protein
MTENNDLRLVSPSLIEGSTGIPEVEKTLMPYRVLADVFLALMETVKEDPNSVQSQWWFNNLNVLVASHQYLVGGIDIFPDFDDMITEVFEEFIENFGIENKEYNNADEVFQAIMEHDKEVKNK